MAGCSAPGGLRGRALSGIGGFGGGFLEAISPSSGCPHRQKLLFTRPSRKEDDSSTASINTLCGSPVLCSCFSPFFAFSKKIFSRFFGCQKRRAKPDAAARRFGRIRAVLGQSKAFDRRVIGLYRRSGPLHDRPE